jgi:hypothetical protein
VDVFAIGSLSPAMVLVDALDLFEQRKPKADENIRSIVRQPTIPDRIC